MDNKKDWDSIIDGYDKMFGHIRDEITDHDNTMIAKLNAMLMLLEYKAIPVSLNCCGVEIILNNKSKDLQQLVQLEINELREILKTQ